MESVNTEMFSTLAGERGQSRKTKELQDVETEDN